MAKHDSRTDKTPEWLVERLALGELGPADAAALRRRLEADGRPADEVIAALEASNREILAAHPAAAIAASIRRRAASPAAPARVASSATLARVASSATLARVASSATLARVASSATLARGRWRGLLIGAPVAAAGLALALLVVRPASVPAPAPAPVGGGVEETRIKGPAATGAPRLVVYRRGRAGAERLADGARATRGDLVQLGYANGAPTWGVLLSIDGAGRVTLHWPERAGQAASLTPAAEIRLPSAYELDDAPAFERFLLVSADQPFEVGSVVEAARTLAARPGTARLAPLPLGGRFRQSSLTLDKSSGGPR